MLLDSSKIEAVLLNKNISSFEIEKGTGIDRASISRFRSGKRDIKNISLMTAIKVQKWISDQEFSFILEGNSVDNNQQK